MWKCKILIGVSGSISTYKICEVVSKLIQWGHDVRIMATPNSLNFVGSSTWEGLTGHPPLLSSFQEGHQMAHIHWQRECDLIVYAPATANTINSMSAGLGGSPLLDLFLAHDFKKPFLIAPAMNHEMWNHPSTKKSFRNLQEMGLIFAGPEAGRLACKENGAGRLIEPKDLLALILNYLPKPVGAQKVLLTYGGTEESIDDVRTLSNKSSGKTGAKLAAELARLGHQVSVLRSERAPEADWIQNQKTFTDTASLSGLLKECFQHNPDISSWIQMAAVADFSVDQVESKEDISTSKKLSSDLKQLTLHLRQAPKLIQELTPFKPPDCRLVAFKLTSHGTTTEIRAAVDRLRGNAPVDLTVHNDMKDHAAGAPVYTAFDKSGAVLACVDGIENLAELLSKYFFEKRKDSAPLKTEAFHDPMP